jgi:hypothetical protein
MQERERAMRAATSYAYNKELMPKVEERLAKALSVLESYLLQTGQDAVRLGRYQVERRNGEMYIAPAPPDGWEQRELGLEARPDYAPRELEEKR